MSNNGSLRGYSQEGKGTNAASDIPKAPEAMEFGNIKTPHHQRHIKELGYKNEKEYISGAIEFFNSDRGELYYNSRDSRFYRYENKTFIVAVCDERGTVLTYFRARKRWIDTKKELRKC